MLQLTTEVLQKYVGLNVQINKVKRGRSYRGDAKSLVVKKGKLRIRFAWIGRFVGDRNQKPSKRLPFVWYSRLSWAFDLKEYSVTSTEFDRIILTAANGDKVVIFSKTDGKFVRGDMEDRQKLAE